MDIAAGSHCLRPVLLLLRSQRDEALGQAGTDLGLDLVDFVHCSEELRNYEVFLLRRGSHESLMCSVSNGRCFSHCDR